MVYDVTNMASFKAVDKWYQQILKNTDNRVICILIGNKKDKVKREVSYKVAAEYARKNNFGLMEVSAKSGSGVKEAFGRLIYEIYSQIESENDPEKPQVQASERIGVISREEIHKNSLVLDAGLHYRSPDQDQEDDGRRFSMANDSK